MIVTSLSLAVGTLLLLLYLNWQRAKIKFNYKLTPNCLLTRYPIVFLSGKKSLFYFGNYWNFVPQFLRDHGYEVIDLELPWRNPDLRKQILLQTIERFEKSGVRIHIVGDSTCETDLQEISHSELSNIESLWKITGELSAPTPVTSKDLRPTGICINEYVIATNNNKFSLLAKLWQLLLVCHSRLVRRPFNISAVGHPQLADLSLVGSYYLKFAISLAENDL